jgi:uncharacterized phage protein (TIGR01671 family)
MKAKKYRIFHNGVMHYPQPLQSIRIFSDGSGYLLDSDDESTRIAAFSECNTFPVPDKHGLLMECIGMADKNGIYIYKGDVLKGSLIYPDSETGVLPTMGVVEYSDEYAAYGIENDGGFTLFHNHLIKDFEILGNIHQSPNLINK